MNIHLKIRECVDKRGTEVIVTSTLIGMLDDEQVFEDINSVPYKKILRNIIKEGYAQKLLDLGSYTPDVNFLASQYAQANLMQKGHVLYVLDCLAYGLGWMDDEPTLQIGNNQSHPASAQGSAVQESSIPKAVPSTSNPAQKNESGGFFKKLSGLFSKKESSSYEKYLDKFQEELNLEEYTVSEIKDAVSPYFESVVNGTRRGVSSEIVYIVALLLYEEDYSDDFIDSVLDALAKDNYAPAMCCLGHRILNEICGDRILDEIDEKTGDEDWDADYILRYYFKKAADMGYVPAFRGMAYCYTDLERYDKSIECYQKAISKGYIRACLDLGLLYSNKLNQPDNAVDCFEKGARKGDADCAYYAASAYIDGNGVDPDYEVALDYFEQASKSKDSKLRVAGQAGMGICYYRKLQEYGVTPTKDSLKCYKDAERLLLVGAQKNNRRAQLFLGRLYLRYGHIYVRAIDDKDLKNKTYEWLKKAADGGGTEAKEAKKLLWEFRGYWPNKPI